MTNDPLKVEAQTALDELMQEHQLPFKLNAGEVVVKDAGQYTIRFFDSRLHSITVTWEEGQSFKEIVRVAVMKRVSRLSGPLPKKPR